MCYVNSTPALRFLSRDWPVCITQLHMQICYVNSTRTLRFVLSMIGQFLSDHAVSSCITRSRNREQLYFQTDYFKVYYRCRSCSCTIEGNQKMPKCAVRLCASTHTNAWDDCQTVVLALNYTWNFYFRPKSQIKLL